MPDVSSTNDRKQRREAALKKAAKKKKTEWIVGSILVVVAVVVAYVLLAIIMPRNKYMQAQQALENNDFPLAYKLFAELKDYEDSPQKIIEVKKQAYGKAKEAMDERLGFQAAKLFLISLGYSDSKDMFFVLSDTLSISQIQTVIVQSIEYESYGNASVWKDLISKYLAGSRWATRNHSYKSYDNKMKTPHYTWGINENLRMKAESEEKYPLYYFNHDGVETLYFNVDGMTRDGDIIKYDVNQKAAGVNGGFSYIIHTELNVKEEILKVYCNKSNWNLCNFTLETYRIK